MTIWSVRLCAFMILAAATHLVEPAVAGVTVEHSAADIMERSRRGVLQVNLMKLNLLVFARSHFQTDSKEGAVD